MPLAVGRRRASGRRQDFDRRALKNSRGKTDKFLRN
jgi:hypothetical protein